MLVHNKVIRSLGTAIVDGGNGIPRPSTSPAGPWNGNGGGQNGGGNGPGGGNG